jgi:hypothetical protein
MDSRSRPSTKPIQVTLVPADDEYVIVLDTTQIDAAPVSIAAGSELLSPGGERNRFAGFEVGGVVQSEGQAVTLYLQAYVGSGASPDDWDTEADGTLTIDADTKVPLSWVPQGADFRLLAKAGATKPTALIFNLYMKAR